MRRTERTHDGLDAPDGLLRLGGVERRSVRVGVDGVKAPLRKGCGVEVREVGVGAR